MTFGDGLFMGMLLLVMMVSVQKGKLTYAGALMAGAIGCCIFLGAGFTGIAMIGLFFLLGISATSWQIKAKQRSGLAEKNNGQRTAGQVIANGGMAALTGLSAWIFPLHQSLFQLMMAGALASATADTLSSELGNIYGKNFYNILNFKKEQKGENGVISLEGTVFGILGSTLVAIVYAAGFGWNWQIWVIILAGTAGNITDSILGATLERKNLLHNDAVNLLNTLAGALMAVFLSAFF